MDVILIPGFWLNAASLDGVVPALEAAGDRIHPSTAELARIHTAELVDLPTGHWPQFTRPAELGAALARALS